MGDTQIREEGRQLPEGPKCLEDTTGLIYRLKTPVQNYLLSVSNNTVSPSLQHCGEGSFV